MSTPSAVGPPPVTPFFRWHRCVLGLSLAIFVFYVGILLLLFPWTRYWDMNWLPLHSRRLSALWLSPYVRGAVSGLGLLNLYLSLSEAVRQIRRLFVHLNADDQSEQSRQ